MKHHPLKYTALALMLVGAFCFMLQRKVLMENSVSTRDVILLKKPIPKEVLDLIKAEKQITKKSILGHEWINDTIQITTGVIYGPLDGHGFEFIAVKTDKGWELHNIVPWQS